jgi:hypothetical protein
MIKTKEEIFRLLWDESGNKRMAGWWKDLLFDAYEAIDNYQKANNIDGNIAEIGIYQGRSLIPLANFRSGDELVIAMDNGKWVTDRIYEKHLHNAYSSTDKIKLFFESSKDTSKYLNYCPFRLFYIDGDHSTEMTLNDLKIARQVLNDRGIMFVDDYKNDKFGPGIRKAVDMFLSEFDDCDMVFTIGETLFIAKKPIVQEYRNLFNEKFSDWIITKDKVYGQLDNFVHPSGYLNYSVKLNKA